MNTTCTQIKAAEGRARVRLVRDYRRGTMSFADLQRKASLVGDGSRWTLLNLSSVVQAMSSAHRCGAHRGNR